MEGNQIEYDFLKFAQDYSIKSNITREEEIQFSDTVQKINKNGWKQSRNLLLTNKAIYNLKKKDLKRRIDYKAVRGITLSKITDEFIIHCEDLDYDYQFISPKKKTILEIIAKNYEIIRQEELKLFEINSKNLNPFVTTKKDKEKQQNLSRMPKTGQIRVKDYLYGNKPNTNTVVNTTQPKIAQKSQINTSQSIKPTTPSIKPPTQSVRPTTTQNSKPLNQSIKPNNTQNSKPMTQSIKPATKTNVKPTAQNNIKPTAQNSIKPNTQNSIKPVTQSVRPKTTQSVRPAQSNKPNFKDFEMIKVIGRGSVGKIFLAKYKKDGKYYAVKSMRKDQIISEGIADNILVEKNILMEGKCEFILKMNFFYQTQERLYFACPFIIGGDLYHKLKNEIFFKEDLVRFYTAQVAIALQHLHDLNIAYRDLKPENILLDEDGYIKLCDFGSSIFILGAEKIKNFAGSPEYAAPEVITYSGHTIMCDWWSLGILIYELLYGNTPFFNMDKTRMFDLINSGSLSFPKFIQIEGEEKPRNYKVSDDAENIITKLLEKDPEKRLGRQGIIEIKKHPFFSGINFDDLIKKKVKPPFRPNFSKDENDLTINIDEEYLNLEIKNSPTGQWAKRDEYKHYFDNFNKDIGFNSTGQK